MTNIGVGLAQTGWHLRVLSELQTYVSAGCTIRISHVNMDAHDWLAQTKGLDALIWNPCVMGPVAASLFKERVYFLERHRGIRVMPSYETMWHFESKVAQSYLFEALELPRPRTVASFDYYDALNASSQIGMPIVAKRSHGAGSSNVWLVRSRRELERHLQQEFAQQLWEEHKSEASILKYMSWAFQPWFRQKLVRTLLGGERHGCVYLQEFIAGQDADLRVVVIGSRALAAWRGNRKNDFRASGGGRAIWDRPIPEAAIRLCLETSRRIGADSLAYDLLFRDGHPLIVEISYSTPPEPAHDVPGHWLLHGDERLEWVDGNRWPQELWVMELMEELGLEK